MWCRASGVRVCEAAPAHYAGQPPQHGERCFQGSHQRSVILSVIVHVGVKPQFLTFSAKQEFTPKDTEEYVYLILYDKTRMSDTLNEPPLRP